MLVRRPFHLLDSQSQNLHIHYNIFVEQKFILNWPTEVIAVCAVRKLKWFTRASCRLGVQSKFAQTDDGANTLIDGRKYREIGRGGMTSQRARKRTNSPYRGIRPLFTRPPFQGNHLLGIAVVLYGVSLLSLLPVGLEVASRIRFPQGFTSNGGSRHWDWLLLPRLRLETIWVPYRLPLLFLYCERISLLWTWGIARALTRELCFYSANSSKLRFDRSALCGCK